MMPKSLRASGSNKRRRSPGRYTLQMPLSGTLRFFSHCTRRLASFIVLPAVLLGLALGGPTAAVANNEYVLGPQDKVRIKVYEWRASRDIIFEWTALNDEFTVSAGGSLSLPFAGEIPVTGLTPNSLAYAIGDQLMRNMGLGRRPDAAVEVIQYRPFYVVGHVMTPGEFPYRPDLTVLQALSIAGGLRRSEESMARFEREVIQGRGDVSLLGLENINLLARKSRLQAELAEAAEVQFPTSLTSRREDRTIALLIEQEVSIFKARREGQRTQVRALENLRAFLEKELVSLDAQLVFRDKQIASIQQELSDVSSLVSKGLAAAPREMSLDRTLAQYQSDRLTAETSLLRTRQEISKTEVAILELRNRYKNEVTLMLRETQAQIEALERKADTAFQLLHESETAAPRLLARQRQAARAKPVYTIVRTSNGRSEELQATETTMLSPGDTLTVEIPMPELKGFEGTSVKQDASDLTTFSIGQTKATETNAQ